MFPFKSAAYAVMLLLPSLCVWANTEKIDLKNLASQDWTGSVLKTTHEDGSVLSEYVAQTFSGNSAGVALSISFVPRFQCTPIISVVLPPDFADLDTPVSVSVDQEIIDFPVLIDSDDETGIRYSMNAGKDVQQAMRMTIDNGSRAALHWEGARQGDDESSEAEIPASENERESVYFSLLGSTKTTGAIEQRCQSHQPIALKE